jgi:hypothetical protein
MGSEREKIVADAETWWALKMRESKFVSARVDGTGRVDVWWKDADESGEYTLPENFRDHLTTERTDK